MIPLLKVSERTVPATVAQGGWELLVQAALGPSQAGLGVGTPTPLWAATQLC